MDASDDPAACHQNGLPWISTGFEAAVSSAVALFFRIATRLRAVHLGVSILRAST